MFEIFESYAVAVAAIAIILSIGLVDAGGAEENDEGNPESGL
jgi:hypothetical protein